MPKNPKISHQRQRLRMIFHPQRRQGRILGRVVENPDRADNLDSLRDRRTTGVSLEKRHHSGPNSDKGPADVVWGKVAARLLD